jgi:antitoxin (DNA-binding transcriptional repressor) of toxin-antitoxin stability system
MIHSVNIRAFKDQLSAHLRWVKQGDVVLVTDRGRVVAEVRQPSLGRGARGERAQSMDKRDELAAEGALSIGLPNAASAYRDAETGLAADVIDQALAQGRGAS